MASFRLQRGRLHLYSQLVRQFRKPSKSKVKGDMQRIALFLAVLMFVGCGRAQDSAVSKWNATVRVVNESNQPMQWANVTIGYYVPPPPTGQAIALDSVKGKTDTDGQFSGSGPMGSTDLFFGADKEGYYHAHLEHAFHKFSDSDPTKRNPTVTLLLKRIKHPISMYAKRMKSQPPVSGKAVGYDLEVGDWITPYGSGFRADILFATYFEKRAGNDWDYKVIVSFPNPGDGIQPFVISGLEQTSSLRSP